LKLLKIQFNFQFNQIQFNLRELAYSLINLLFSHCNFSILSLGNQASDISASLPQTTTPAYAKPQCEFN